MQVEGVGTPGSEGWAGLSLSDERSIADMQACGMTPRTYAFERRLAGLSFSLRPDAKLDDDVTDDYRDTTLPHSSSHSSSFSSPIVF